MMNVVSIVHSKRFTRVSKHKNIGLEALKVILFPVRLTNIEKYEERSNISINLYAYDEDYKIDIPQYAKNKLGKYISQFYKRWRKISLFMGKNISRSKSEQLLEHYGKIFTYDRLHCNSFYSWGFD